MQSSTEKSRFGGGHLAISFIVGAIAGVAVAFLTAPVSGREARMQLGRLVRRGKQQVSRAQGAIGEKIDEAKQRMGEAYSAYEERH